MCHKRILPLFLGMAFLISVVAQARATENVAAVRSEADDNWVLDTAVALPYYPPTSHLRPVGVYTTGEINMMVERFDKRLDNMENANALVEQRVREAEIRMRGELKRSLEALPQQLSLTEAINHLRESLLEELHSELGQLRQDLQKQIDEVKKPQKP